MATLPSALDAVVNWLLRTSWQAAVLAILVLSATWLLRRWLPPSARYGLLLLVAARLLMPVMPQSRSSIFNLLQKPDAPAAKVETINEPASTGDWVITKQPISVSRQLAMSPADAPAATANDFFTWRTALLCAWLLGIAVIAIRIARANINLFRKVRRAVAIDDPNLLNLLTSCKSEMGVQRGIELLETDAVHSPALMGLFHPRLLLPIGLRDRLTSSELRFVFLHELAHLRREDLAIDWLLAILQTLHWFNPLIALAFARARAERELARDAMVLSVTRPDEETNYGQTILKLVESFGRLAARPGTIGILENSNGKKHLKRRITMIANFKRTMRGGTILAAAIALLLIASALTDKRASAADPQPAAKPAAPADQDAVKSQPAPRTAPAWPDVGLLREANQARDREVAALDAAVQKVLDRRLPQVRFDKMVLTDVIDFLRDVTGANIQVQWKALEASGIDRATTVSAQLRDVKFSHALTTILDDASGGAVKLGYEIENGVLVITTAEELEKKTVVEVYDIRDLLEDGKDEKAKKEILQDLTKLIEDTIDRNTWIANGGNVGAIKHLSGQMIVTQTKQNHRKLVALLDKLREARAIHITLQARLIEVPSKFLEDIRPQPKIKWNDDNATAFLDPKEADQLLKAVQASVNATTLAAPRIMLASGQEGSIMIGQEVPYITGWSDPKAGEKRQPQTSFVKTGFTLVVTPTLSADRKSVSMKLHPRLAHLRKMDSAPWDKSPPGEKLTIQKPDLAVREIDQTLAVPDGGTLLMLLKEDDKEKNEKEITTMLMVRPAIIIQREIEQEQFPLLNNIRN